MSRTALCFDRASVIYCIKIPTVSDHLVHYLQEHTYPHATIHQSKRCNKKDSTTARIVAMREGK